MKIAAAQICLYSDVEQNLENIAEWAKKARAQGVDLLNFPETTLTGYVYNEFSQLDSRTLETALDTVEKLAVELGISLVVGTPYRKGNLLFNSVVAFMPDGKRSVYHKNHLVSYEKEYFSAGSDLLSFQLKTVTVGTIICRDQSFPLLAQRLRDAGTQVLLISCAHYYPPTEARLKVDKNRALPIARACENGFFVCKANAVGSHRGRINLGHSMIVGPNGVVIAEAGETQEELLTFDMGETRFDYGW